MLIFGNEFRVSGSDCSMIESEIFPTVRVGVQWPRQRKDKEKVIANKYHEARAKTSETFTGVDGSGRK